VTTDATCTDKGETVYTSAAFENEAFEVQTKTVEIDALGHDWGETSYVWNSDFSEVTATRTCKRDAAHTETETVSATGEQTKAPTCTEKGETTYTSAAFKNTDFEVQTKTVDNIAALDHNWSFTGFSWVGNDEEGYTKATAEYVCTRDPEHERSEDADFNKVSTEDSCTEPGEVTYTASITSEESPDGQKHEEVKTVKGVVRGHIWGEATYVWSDDNSQVTASHACTACEATDSETVDTTSAVTTPATCEGKGETTITAEFTKEGFKKQTKTEEIPALKHKWGAVTYIWANDNSKVTATRTCENDPSHVQAEPSNTTYKVTKEPTKDEAGEGVYTATFTNSAFETQTKTVVIPKKGSDEPSNPEDQKGTDGTPVGPGASAEAAEKAITSMTSDTDPKGTVFSKLTLRSKKQTNNSISLSWNMVNGATQYVLYGNKCGKGIKPQKLTTLNSNSFTLRNVAGASLKKGTYYKVIIVALDKNNKVVSTSKLIHVATKGGKVGNHKSVKVSKKVIKKAKSLKKGKSLKLKAKAVAQSKKLKVKKHVGVRYESTNTKVATVSSSGKVKAKSKGTCYVYAYAQNGVYKKIKVTVK
jgi:hypothetical protein